MNVSFNDIAPASRIWVFQSSHPFSAAQEAEATRFLRDFTEGWQVHGSPVKAAFDIRYNQFIILAADESYNAPSGCSIDSAVRAVQDLESLLGTKLFDRQQAAFLVEDRILLIPTSQLKQKFAEGIWNEHTPSFNNLVATKNQLADEWITPARNNWIKRYIPSTRVAT